jgi:hypothetical protein
VTSRKRHGVFYNVLRPAILGSVAQEPPRTILCLPSKKSAVRKVSMILESEISLTGICWVQRHGFKSFVFLQRGACPLPHASQFCLTSEFVAICSNSHRMPVLKSDVGTAEVSEEIFRSSAGDYSCRWWALLDTIVNEMTISRSVFI